MGQILTAELCARLSRLAYEDQLTVAAVCSDIDLPRVAWFEKDDTQAFIARSKAPSPPIIVMAFRGTESFEDVIYDLDATLIDGKGRSSGCFQVVRPALQMVRAYRRHVLKKGGRAQPLKYETRAPLGGRCHAGFLDALAPVWPAMREHFMSAMREAGPDTVVLVTGHSLGAALATLAAAELAEDGLKVSGLYTYGSPSVGDRRFARALECWLGPERIFRAVNNNDAVIRMPPWFAGYRHAGAARYLTTDGRLVTSPAWWSLLWDRLRGRWEHFGRPGTDGLEDHKMGGYVSAITAAAGNPDES